MLVATFGPSTSWAGRGITYENGQFTLEGYGLIPVAGLLDYDRRGQLTWMSPELRTWAFSFAHWAATTATPGTVPQRPSGSAAPAKQGFPVWAVILIVAIAAVIVVGILAAILIPMFVFRAEGILARETTVRDGIYTIQGGLESWAADHGGRYPDPDRVNPYGLQTYVSEWPHNPYADLPMVQGVNPGDFGYEVSPRGTAYRLVGYGANGSIVIDVDNGWQDTI